MRYIHTATLTRKMCLSDRAQCFHLEFRIEELSSFDFSPGQFVSFIADDSTGKRHTRAYSIASSPRKNEFDICVNRVEGGFFSNLLADLKEGQALQFHGPHGLFVLRHPLTDALLIATGTGVAPMLAFCQSLFSPEEGDLSEGHEVWLVYGTRYETEIYYREYFEELASKYSNFHYIPTLSRPHPSWVGRRGYVQQFVQTIAVEHAAIHPTRSERDQLERVTGEDVRFGIRAYICGLNEMVSANRETLLNLGWRNRQIVFERYD